jgi:Mce-associated membrane protein
MRFRRRLLAVAGPMVIAVIIGLSAAGGWFFWERVQTEGEQSARAQLPKLAAKEISDIFGYDYQTVERSLSAAYPWLTPEYRREFEKRAIAQIIPEAKKRQVVVQANVVGVGVMSARRTSASVMVYMNQTVTDKASRDPVYNGSRLRVDFKKIGDEWLIAYITPI